MLNYCEFVALDQQFTTTTPMTGLKLLRVHCRSRGNVEPVLKFIRVPQFKDLDTVRLSVTSGLWVVATDGSGHTFEFFQARGDVSNFYPLRHLGAEITTLRLDRGSGITLQALDHSPVLFDFFRSLDALQVLEFDVAITSARTLRYLLCEPGVFPGLKVIRVVISWDDCKEALEGFAAILRLRMEEGNPLVAIEPLSAEGVGEGGLDPGLRAEWDERYETEGIHNFLSK